MIISVFIATLILWLWFIATAKVAQQADELSDLSFLRKVFVILFVIGDVLYNYTYGSVLFLELADNDRKTLTARLKHYLRTEPETWRGKLSLFMCKYMIEPFDPGHCSISN